MYVHYTSSTSVHSRAILSCSPCNWHSYEGAIWCLIFSVRSVCLPLSLHIFYFYICFLTLPLPFLLLSHFLCYARSSFPFPCLVLSFFILSVPQLTKLQTMSREEVDGFVQSQILSEGMHIYRSRDFEGFGRALGYGEVKAVEVAAAVSTEGSESSTVEDSADCSADWFPVPRVKGPRSGILVLDLFPLRASYVHSAVQCRGF